MPAALPRSNDVFPRLGAALLAALLQVGLLVAAEPSDEGPEAKPESTVPVAQEGVEPVRAPDETVGAEREHPNLRTWTDVTGKYRTEAAFLGLENGQVRLEKRDGSITIVAIERLSDLDQQYVQSQTAPEEVPVEPSEEAGMQPEQEAEPAVESRNVEPGLVPPRESGGMGKPAIEDEPSEAGPKPVESPIAEKPGTPQAADSEEQSGAPQPGIAGEPASQPEIPQPVGSQPVAQTGKTPVIIVSVVAGAILILALLAWGLMRRKRGVRRARGDARVRPLPQDPRIAKAVEAITSQIELSPETITVKSTGAEGQAMEVARQFEQLHRDHPEDAQLHYAYAAALQVAAQGATARQVLQECVKAHPRFWIADITFRRNSLYGWNPFFLPEFDPQSKSVVHPVIQRIVSTNVLLATRRGLLPSAVLFLRDSGGEFSPSKLQRCKIEFLTTISKVTDPQVVAINGRIHDNPTDPFQLEVTQCPFRALTDRDRLVYELFVRQDSFDFVVLDRLGNVKYARCVRPSARMKAAHARLANMFDEEKGEDLSTPRVMDAIIRHQRLLDPRKLKY